MKKTNLIYVVSVFLALLFFTSAISWAEDNDPHRTGLIRPSAEEREQEVKTMFKVKRVHLNKLGLERVNAHRAKHGLSLLNESEAMPVGAEIEATVGEAEINLNPAENLTPEALPSYLDNSTLKYFPPIRSQGSLGSCASFASTYYAMTHMYALARNLDAKNGGDNYRFSPKWMYNMINGGVDGGSWHYTCYALALKHGSATWAEFPYDANYRAWCLNPAVWRSAIYKRFQQYGTVASLNTDTGLNQLKELLVNGYILNFATYVMSWQYKTIGNDPSTSADDPFVGKSCASMVNGTSGGHAMTIVGYNDDIWVDINGDGLVTPDEKGALRIANSWGTGWGEAGFCWLAYQAIRTRNPGHTSEGIFWYDEAGWITARSSYTPQLIAEFTLNHLKRNQLQMKLGTAATGATTPTITWSPLVINRQGGPYAFDGTTVACDGSFALDFTELLPVDGSLKRYFLGMNDGTAGDLAVLKANKLVNLSNGATVIATDVPKTVDAGQVYSFVDYQRGTVNLPVAVISASPTSGYLPLAVAFNGAGSYGISANIVAYAWDFGDGSAGTGATITHTYNNYGTFIASLTVTDDQGFSSVPATVTITVQDNNQPPVAMVTAAPLSGIVPLAVSFSGANSYDPDGSIAGYSWNFGDGATSVLQNPAHTYNTVGQFNAKLTVTDNKSASASSSVTINVTADPDTLAQPRIVSLTNLGNTITLTWADNSNNETGFYIERGIRFKGSVTYSRVGTVDANVTTFSETLANGTYYYQVQAFSSLTGRVSAYSSSVQIKVGTKGRK